MGIQIDNEFDVTAAPDDVYALMIDVERVAPCIPGAEVIGRRDDGTYDVKASVKMGPLTQSYKGVAEIAESDPTARTAQMKARASEQRGGGTAQALMSMAVVEIEGGSRVSVSSDILVTGRVAQMGRGIMIDVAGRMVGEMAKAMQETLDREAEYRRRVAEVGTEAAGPPPESVQAETPNALKLGAGALWKKIRD